MLFLVFVVRPCTVRHHIMHFCIVRPHSNWFFTVVVSLPFLSMLIESLVVNVSSSCLCVHVLVVVLGNVK